MKYPHALALLVVLILMVSPGMVSAAQVSVQSRQHVLGLEQLFQVDVVIDVEGDRFNAIEGSLVFPADLLEPLEVLNATTPVSLWMEEPRLPLQTPGRIPFSGITPGGFNGTAEILFSVRFRTSGEGASAVTIEGLKLLRNDENATDVQTKVSALALQIAPIQLASIVPVTVRDTDPPEPIAPEISRSEAVYDGAWFIAFATQDKGSGIAQYDLLESPKRLGKAELQKATEWIPVQSPARLKDQARRSYVYVRAVDKFGNARVAEVSPEQVARNYEEAIAWGILGVLVAYVLWRRWRNLPQLNR